MDEPGPAVNLPDVVAEVTDAFRRYEAALMGERVDELIAAFWVSPRTIRFGVDDVQYGHDEVVEFRRAHGAATPPRRLRNTVVTTFGSSFATVDTEFLPDGSDAVGRQSQTWVRLAEGWRVTSAHVSFAGGRAPD